MCDKFVSCFQNTYIMLKIGVDDSLVYTQLI